MAAFVTVVTQSLISLVEIIMASSKGFAANVCVCVAVYMSACLSQRTAFWRISVCVCGIYVCVCLYLYISIQMWLSEMKQFAKMMAYCFVTHSELYYFVWLNLMKMLHWGCLDPSWLCSLCSKD